MLKEMNSHNAIGYYSAKVIPRFRLPLGPFLLITSLC